MIEDVKKAPDQPAGAGLVERTVRPLSRERQTSECKAWSDWAWNKSGEAVGLQDGQSASREAWLARAELAEAEAERLRIALNFIAEHFSSDCPDVVTITPQSMRQAVAQCEIELSGDWCETCPTVDACRIRGSCSPFLGKR